MKYLWFFMWALVGYGAGWLHGVIWYRGKVNAMLNELHKSVTVLDTRSKEISNRMEAAGK